MCEENYGGGPQMQRKWSKPNVADLSQNGYGVVVVVAVMVVAVMVVYASKG